MALFTPSTIPWVTAVQQIADSAGASADTEMLNRAHLSLRASFQYFNTKARWGFLRTEGNPTQVVAPFILSVTASAGQASASALTGHGVKVDDILIGSGFILGNRVSATAASGFGFNVAITGFGAGDTAFDATVVRDSYDLPSSWKATYSLRMLGSDRALTYIGRRLYDRSSTNDPTSGAPEAYDLFNSYGRGKIRLLPAPSDTNVFLHRYLRSMALASASGVTAALDIPEDYESYVIAWAKWHFLTDKGEGKKEQATTWVNLASEGLKTMLMEQNALPDEDLAFIPSHFVSNVFAGDNSTRLIAWDY